ncbi:MAG: hypothetical protein HYX81_02740 [Chloroflexi bacterium]|nr:hypothetical protein [Chloroflexota bacterium]
MASHILESDCLVGAGLVFLGVVLSFFISMKLVFPGLPKEHPTFGIEAVYVYVALLDIIGLPIMLSGGLVSKPRYFWQASIVIGLLHIASLWGFVLFESFGRLKEGRINLMINELGIAVLPGLIAIGEGIILKQIEARSQTALGKQ